MRYLPLTAGDRAQMLAAIGVDSIDALFDDVPAAARLDGPVDLPRAMGEIEVERLVSHMAARNVAAGSVPFFIGGGVYRHHIRLRGRTSDRDCGRRSEPKRTEVSVARRTVDGKCRFLTRRGHLSARRRCGERSYLPARGTIGWHAFRRWPGLPGTYLIASRAVDSAGNVELRSVAANGFLLRVGPDLRVLHIGSQRGF